MAETVAMLTVAPVQLRDPPTFYRKLLLTSFCHSGFIRKRVAAIRGPFALEGNGCGSTMSFT